MWWHKYTWDHLEKCYFVEIPVQNQKSGLKGKSQKIVVERFFFLNLEFFFLLDHLKTEINIPPGILDRQESQNTSPFIPQEKKRRISPVFSSSIFLVF